MATTKFDLKSQATRTVYAGFGVTDLAVEAVRDYVADVQKRFADFQKLDAKQARAAVEARVAELQAEAIEFPAKLQGLVDENMATAAGAYGDLAKRGEVLVGRIRRQQSTQATAAAASTTTVKAKTTRTQGGKATTSTAKKTATTAKKTVANKSAPARSSAKATGTAAKKTVANSTKAAGDAAAKVGD